MWMNLDNIMPCETSLSQKDKYRVIPLIGDPGGVRFLETGGKVGPGTRRAGSRQ